MKANRRLALVCVVSASTTICGDLLLLLVVNSLRTGVPIEQRLNILAVGGLLGCFSLPLAYALGYSVLSRVIRPTAKITAAIISFCGIVSAINGPMIHGMTWMTIRAAVAAGTISSSPPMDAMVKQGGMILSLWLTGSLLLLVISILILWSGIRRPHAIPLWLALLNPVVLTLLIGALGSLSGIGRSYVVPVAPNVAHLVFFVALYWWLPSGNIQPPASPSLG